MADEGFKRRLTAILREDVIGYSRLMRDDENATVSDLASQTMLKRMFFFPLLWTPWVDLMMPSV